MSSWHGSWLPLEQSIQERVRQKPERSFVPYPWKWHDTTTALWNWTVSPKRNSVASGPEFVLTWGKRSGFRDSCHQCSETKISPSDRSGGCEHSLEETNIRLLDPGPPVAPGWFCKEKSPDTNSCKQENPEVRGGVLSEAYEEIRVAHQQCLLHLYSGIIGNDKMAQQEGIKLDKWWCFHTMGESTQPLTTKLPKMIYCHGTGGESQPQSVCIILRLKEI